jgi:hypothetical protein
MRGLVSRIHQKSFLRQSDGVPGQAKDEGESADAFILSETAGYLFARWKATGRLL